MNCSFYKLISTTSVSKLFSSLTAWIHLSSDLCDLNIAKNIYNIYIYIERENYAIYFLQKSFIFVHKNFISAKTALQCFLKLHHFWTPIGSNLLWLNFEEITYCPLNKKFILAHLDLVSCEITVLWKKSETILSLYCCKKIHQFFCDFFRLRP